MVTLALALQLTLAAAAATPAQAPTSTSIATSTSAETSTETASATPKTTPAASTPPAATAAVEPTLSLIPPEPRPLASMTLIPQELDRGPFRPGEMAGATLGAFAGDAIVLGSGYWALQMFANGTIPPTAAHFRHAVYALGIGALVVPPVTAVLMAKLVAGPHARYGFWKALALASLGQVAALTAGYYAAPRFWVVLPVQAIALSLGTTLGLHWGAHARAAEPAEAAPDEGREAASRPPPATAALGMMPLCTEG